MNLVSTIPHRKQKGTRFNESFVSSLVFVFFSGCFAFINDRFGVAAAQNGSSLLDYNRFALGKDTHFLLVFFIFFFFG